MQYLLFLIIPFFSFLLQSYPRFINKYFGVDVWTRMIEADIIRKNKHRIPMKKIEDRFMLHGYFNYPPVFPWIFSFFSKKTLLEIQGYIAPFFDCLQNILVAIITFQLTGRLDLAIISQIIYSTIPLLVLENCSLSPRSLGYLNFTLAFYPLLLYSVTPNPVYIIAGILFTILIFFTHKFATQSLFFITVFFSIFEGRPFYILIFISGLIVAIIISKGYYFRIFKGHVGNIYFWVKNYQYRFSHQIRGLIKSREQTDFVGQVYFLLLKFSPLTLIGTNLWMIFVFVFLLGRYLNLNPIFLENPIYYKMSVWVIFMYILSIIVLSFKRLTPIGEGQRYLEMTVVPSSVIATVTLTQLNKITGYISPQLVFFSILLINLTVIVVLQWKAIIKDKNRTMTKDMNKIFSFLDGLKIRPKILCIPHQITTMVLYNIKRGEVLVDIEAGTLQKISDVFPILQSSVKDIAKKYDLNIL
ncbi:MAG: hypothetical protein M1524_00430, partial [Patescibacteria group bacterium]|nr:hypothetical protein [Patescibacteria group bacterium]